MKKVIILASIVVAIVFLALLFWPKKIDKQNSSDIQNDSLNVSK